jgi:tetratricopeptide (TPR) repeat protein
MNLEKAQKLWFLLHRFDRTNRAEIDVFKADKERYPFFYLLHWNEKNQIKQQRKIALKSNSRLNYFKSIHDIESVEIENPFEFNIKLDSTNNIQAQLIEDFLLKMPTITKIKKISNESELIEEIDFSEVTYQAPTTESYAIILEKQGKYDLAIKVYEKLSLAKPEKRLYFASRISEIAFKINN